MSQFNPMTGFQQNQPFGAAQQSFGGYGNFNDVGGISAGLSTDVSSPGMLSSFGNWLTGSTDPVTKIKTDGGGGMLLGAAQGLGNMYMGMKQYGLAKDSLANNKDQFAKNYAAQRQTTNASMEDRQRARIASNGSAYESVGSYMSKNGIN